MYQKPDRTFEELSHRVIGCAIEVHRELGPGLLESAYQRCLTNELTRNNIDHACEVLLPISYKGDVIDCGYRADILIGQEMLLELKSVKQLDPIHEAQLLTYMKLSSVRVGLLLNFNVDRLKDGMKRLVL